MYAAAPMTEPQPQPRGAGHLRGPPLLARDPRLLPERDRGRGRHRRDRQALRRLRSATVFLIVLVIIGLTVLIGFVKRVATTYTITNRRLNIKRGIISREIQETRLERVQNVNYRQTVYQRLMQIGDVDFDTAATDDYNFVFVGVADPGDVVHSVDRATGARRPRAATASARRSRPRLPRRSLPAMAKDLSVVVFGATGITGRQVCAYLAERAEQTRLQVGGGGPRRREGRPHPRRDRGRARRRRSAPTSSDAASLAAMASRAKVVLDMVGPYTLYGEPVIEACIAGGAHYMDLTGEMPFVRRMIEAADERAERRRGQDRQHQRLRGAAARPARPARGRDRARALERGAGDGRPRRRPADPERQRCKLSDIISGGTLQSLAEILDDDGAALAADSGAPDRRGGAGPAGPQRQPDRDRPPLQRPGRRGHADDALALHQPGRRSTAPRRCVAAEEGRAFTPFRYREGVAIPGGPATVPLRYAAGGALGGHPGGDPGAGPGAARRSAADAAGSCARASPPPASARPASAWRTGPGAWRSTPKPSAATTSASTSRATASPAT